MTMTLTKRLEKAGVEFKQEIPDTTSAVAMNVILTFPANCISLSE